MKLSKERKIREAFSTKTGGKLYKVFYEGRTYRQKDGGEVLLSKHQVMDKLGIDYDEMTNSEKAFVNKLWMDSIKRFQNRAWDMMQPWGTIRVKHKDGTNVWLHGYSMDPAKQEAMRSFKHWQAVDTYISEKRQEKAFLTADGEDNKAQFELPMREELTSFEYI